MLKESDILFEINNYWVCKSDKFEGYEVYQSGITHSVKVASIGYIGEQGLKRAKFEAVKRAKNDDRLAISEDI